MVFLEVKAPQKLILRKLKMEARLSSETYQVENIDGNNLIPKGTTSIIVSYADNGAIRSIFYGSPAPKTSPENSKAVHKKYSKKLEEMNSKEQTTEEMGRVVGHLKKLSQAIENIDAVAKIVKVGQMKFKEFESYDAKTRSDVIKEVNSLLTHGFFKTSDNGGIRKTCKSLADQLKSELPKPGIKT